jgi:putative SOS response-associated peptidase YedK
MCAGYGFFAPHDFEERFHVQDMTFKLEPRYNVKPSQFMPVITRNSPNKAELMKWGIVPHWVKDPYKGLRPINARAETVATSGVFREPLRSRRCLVPANCFYERKDVGEKVKQPYCIKLKSRPVFAFAGLYNVFRDVEGKELKTFTIITTRPNEIVAPIHDRMPVILTEQGEDIWLDPNTQDINILLGLLEPYDAADMTAYQISTKVNFPQNDDESVITPLAA